MSPVPVDPYDFQNGPGNTADAEQIDARFGLLYGVLAGGLDAENIAAAVRQQLGLSDPATVRRAYAEVLTEQSAAAPASALGDLATVGPQVTIDVPANALVCAAMTVQGKGNDVGYFALSEDGEPMTSADGYGSGLTNASFLTMYPAGNSNGARKRTNILGPFPTTPGTHSYKIVYGSAANTMLTWKNRRLWVWTIGF